ncbi:MAG: 1-phosphofructokinase family hexose kinase [Thermoleophilia bacterium]|jgi:1-phosphofructokinase family hexose kinase
MILTVTLNAALDRTLTVPNFQVGFRHRATDTIILPGGKGINVARAVKTLGRPVIATGFVGGRKGDQIVADLSNEGVLCDFVRVEGESRTYTAVIDPATNVVTEINEHGLDIRPADLDLLFDKLDYLGRAADIAVLAGSLPRGLDDDCYARIIQHLQRHRITIFFYSYGEPLRLGIKVGPDFAFPKLVDAERVIGYEFHDVQDELQAAARMREMGSGSVAITSRYGCVAQLADGERARSFIGRIPEIDVVSPMGWGDALVAGYCVRLREGDPPEECLRFGLGCGAANLVRYGAGVFSAADAAELANKVEVEEVSAES